MKKATDTTKNPRYDWIGGGNPQAIERQEREGQKEITNPVKEHNSIQLPLTESYGVDATEKYKKLGVKFIKKIDDLFGLYKVPEGWKTKATDHSMWNELLNEKGEVVATFFYKAAFYDRDAFINFND